MTTAHGSLPKKPLAFAPLGAARLLGREGLSHELHRVRNLAGVIHLQLDVAVARPVTARRVVKRADWTPIGVVTR